MLNLKSRCRGWWSYTDREDYTSRKISGAVEFKVDDSENSGDVLDKRQEVKSNFKIYYRARSYIRRQWKL